MENEIFTKEECVKAIIHYNCIAAELETLSDYCQQQEDKAAFTRAAAILRSLAEHGKYVAMGMV